MYAFSTLFNPIARDLVDSNVAVVRKALDTTFANDAASQRMFQSPQQKIRRDLLRHSYSLQLEYLVKHHHRVADTRMSLPPSKFDSQSFFVESELPQLCHPLDLIDGQIHEVQRYAHPANFQYLASPAPKIIPLDQLSTTHPILRLVFPQQKNHDSEQYWDRQDAYAEGTIIFLEFLKKLIPIAANANIPKIEVGSGTLILESIRRTCPNPARSPLLET